MLPSVRFGFSVWSENGAAQYEIVFPSEVRMGPLSTRLVFCLERECCRPVQDWFLSGARLLPPSTKLYHNHSDPVLTLKGPDP
jgi:hypothetical protein